MGRSVGNDSGRSVFVGAPPAGGNRNSCGSWPEVRLPSGAWWAWRRRSAWARRRSSVDGFERRWPEVAERVVGAAGELAGDRQRRARMGEAAGLELEVVGVVGALRPAGGLGGLIER